MPKRTRGKDTSTPHDAIIRYTFSQPKHAAGLLKAALAPEIVATLDWSTLTLENIHFVDRALGGRDADFLVSPKIDGEEVFVFMLVEHQSTVERLMIYRMGGYMWRHWERLVFDNPSRDWLPPIVPILIHHSDTGWTAATAFQDVIRAPAPSRAALMPFTPSFSMKLVDVSHDPASGLVAQALTDLGRIVLFCLSVAGDDERLAREIDTVAAELHALSAAPRELDALLAVLRYLLLTHPSLGGDKIAKLVKKTATKGNKEIAMDRFDAWVESMKDEGRAEGKREGIAEGERKGRAGMLLDLLGARFGAVPAKAKARVLAADEETLARWSLRVLTAPTLAAVLDEAEPEKPARKPAGARRAGGKRASGKRASA
jgi:predicted transposase YdaD